MNPPAKQTWLGVLLAISVSIILVISITRAYDFRIAGDLSPSAAPASSMHSLSEMSSKDGNDTFDRSTDSLEALSEAVDTKAPSSTAISNATWTDSRAALLDYLDSDLKYLVSTLLGTPVAGSIGDLSDQVLDDTGDMQPKIGEIADYSGYYSEGTSVFSALKDIRDQLSGY